MKECCARSTNKLHDHYKAVVSQEVNRIKYKMTSELIFMLNEACLYINRPQPNTDGAVKRIREALQFLESQRPGK